MLFLEESPDISVEFVSPVDALRGALGFRKADVVIDVTAKAPAAFGQAVSLARVSYGAIRSETAACFTFAAARFFRRFPCRTARALRRTRRSSAASSNGQTL